METLEAIMDFVKDLDETYGGQKGTPLNNFARLIKNVDIDNTEVVDKFINLFKEYTVTNYDTIVNGSLTKLSKTHRIIYKSKLNGDKIDAYIDVPKFVKRADVDGVKAIQAHLINITRLFVPNEEVLGKVKNMVTNKASITKSELSSLTSGLDDSNESRMINNMMNTISNQLPEMAGNMNPENPEDFMSQIKEMAPALLGQLTSGNNGEIDGRKMMRSLKGMIDNIFSQLENAVNEDTEESGVENPNVKLESRPSAAPTRASPVPIRALSEFEEEVD